MTLVYLVYADVISTNSISIASAGMGVCGMCNRISHDSAVADVTTKVKTSRDRICSCIVVERLPNSNDIYIKTSVLG